MDMDDQSDTPLAKVFEANGIAWTQSNLQHFAVLIECLRLHDSRTASYGKVWRRYGALSNLLSAARKVDRLMESWWRRGDGAVPTIHKDNLDDAYDAINYLVFMVRNARDANLTGE